LIPSQRVVYMWRAADLPESPSKANKLQASKANGLQATPSIEHVMVQPATLKRKSHSGILIETESKSNTGSSGGVIQTGGEGCVSAGNTSLTLQQLVALTASHTTSGEPMAPDQLWEEAGIDSVAVPALMSDIAEALGWPLDGSALIDHPTPRSLCASFLQQKDVRLVVKTPLELSVIYNSKFCSDRHNPYFQRSAYSGTAVLSPFLWQTTAILLNLTLISISAIPPAFLYDHLMNASFVPTQPWKQIGAGMGLLVPLVAAVGWMLMYSLCIIAVKWLVIGRYRECALAYDSPAFMRWWFTDSCIRVWETVVGGYLLGTPYLGFFYLAMGAGLPRCMVMTGGVRCFMRGFDLVQCGQHVTRFKDAENLRSPALLSIHGVWLAPIEIRTSDVMTNVPNSLCPGFKEDEPADPPVALAVDWLDVLQRWLLPGLYLGSFLGILLLANEMTGIALTTLTDVYDGTSSSAVLQGFLVYLGAHISFLLISCWGLALSHVFETSGDYLHDRALGMLTQYVIFLWPLSPLIAWLDGAHVRPTLTYTNRPYSPSVSRRLFIGDGCIIASPQLLPGNKFIALGRGCFLALNSTLEEGVVLGDGVIVDTFAVVPAGSVVPANTYVATDGTWIPIAADERRDLQQYRVGIGQDATLLGPLLCFLTRIIMYPLGDLTSLACAILLVRATTDAGHESTYYQSADASTLLWQVPMLVGAIVSMTVTINLGWFALIERCVHATGIAKLVPMLAMPCVNQMSLYAALIDGSWLQIVLLRLRGARCASLCSVRSYDLHYLYDAALQQWDADVVVQGACISGHRGRPAKTGVEVEVGHVHLATRTVVHPGAMIFNNFSTTPGTVIQSEGTDIRRRTHIHIHEYELE